MREVISSLSMLLLAQFVVLLYDKTSDLVKVNDARKWLFTLRSRAYYQDRQHSHNTLNRQVIKQTAGTWH